MRQTKVKKYNQMSRIIQASLRQWCNKQKVKKYNQMSHIIKANLRQW